MYALGNKIKSDTTGETLGEFESDVQALCALCHLMPHGMKCDLTEESLKVLAKVRERIDKEFDGNVYA